MILRVACMAVIFFWSSGLSANIITLEPDDFAPGTDLSSISPYVSLSTTSGSPVYAAPLAGSGQNLPTGITDTGPFYRQAFSRYQTRNSEWFAWPDITGVNTESFNPDEWSKDPLGLIISFNSPATYVSLLSLELYEDAAWTGDDPIRWWVYDSNDILIFSDYMDMTMAGSIGYNPDHQFDYYYWDMEFSHPDILTVVIGGESEPTTLDRLSFSIKPVPEPNTITLFALGLVGLTGAGRYQIKRKFKL